MPVRIIMKKQADIDLTDLLVSYRKHQEQEREWNRTIPNLLNTGSITVETKREYKVLKWITFISLLSVLLYMWS